MASKIEWTEETWNPVTGCTRVSDGCDHCYIERTMPFRTQHRKFNDDGIGATTGVKLHSERLHKPLRWRKPRRVFVNSLSDLFHDEVPDRFVAEVFAVMSLAPQHTFQLLTKRHARMRSLLRSHAFWTAFSAAMLGRRQPGMPISYDADGPHLRNVWVGVSVENQQWADIRIPALLDTPAAVRWISAEPLLGPVDLHNCSGVDAIEQDWTGGPGGGSGTPHPLLSWVVVGGESGPGARPMELDWARTIVRNCQDAGVPVFCKQLGSRWGREHHDIDQFPEDLRVREYSAPVADPGAINQAPADAVSSVEEV